jgi:hypothetical protein
MRCRIVQLATIFHLSALCLIMTACSEGILGPSHPRPDAPKVQTEAEIHQMMDQKMGKAPIRDVPARPIACQLSFRQVMRPV